MARDTHPTLGTYLATAINNTQSKSFAALSWSVGNVVVVMAGGEGGATGRSFNAPSNQTGLAFAGAAVACNNDCEAAIYTAVATQASSGTISQSASVSADTWGGFLFRWDSTDGLGQRFYTSPGGTARTTNVTPTDTHSGYAWGLFDWNTNSYTNAAFTPTQTDSRQLGLNGGGGGFMISVADLTDLATSSQTAFGLTATAPSSGVFTIVGAEVLGTTSGAPSLPPDLNMAPPDSG